MLNNRHYARQCCFNIACAEVENKQKSSKIIVFRVWCDPVFPSPSPHFSLRVADESSHLI